MMAYSLVTAQGKDDLFDRALDACCKAGIGLVATKTTRGMQKAIDTKVLGDLNLHHDILRYLSYYEQDGKRAPARAKYRAVPPEARHVAREDLAAARGVCAARGLPGPGGTGSTDAGLIPKAGRFRDRTDG
jgi:hypothetical protein